MLADITSFIKDTVTSSNISSSTQPDSLISPRIGQEDAIRISDEISEHYDTLQSEIKGLQYAKEVVIQETQIHANKLQQELHELQEDFSQQIALLTEEVNGKIAQLQSERDSEIAKMTTKNDKMMQETLAEKQKLEKQLLGLEQDKNEYEKRKDLRRSKKDAPGEARWKVRLENVKKQISEVRRKTKSLSDFLGNTQKEVEKTTKKLKENCNKLIDLEKKKIEALEKSRDSEIEKKSERIKDLQRDTLTLTHNIEAQIDQIKVALAEFEEAKIPWDVETSTLIGIPTYIVSQKVKNESRYLLFPPVIAEEHKGLAVTIGSALGFSSLGSRINSLLRPRSKCFEIIFNSLKKELEKDESLEGTVSQIATSKNLLTLPEFQGRLRNGLEQLEDKGWIKPEERDAILMQHAG
jgi:myosin heavy subunit